MRNPLNEFRYMFWEWRFHLQWPHSQRFWVQLNRQSPCLDISPERLEFPP